MISRSATEFRAIVTGLSLILPSALPGQSARVARAAEAAHRPIAEFTLEPHRTRWALRTSVGGKPFRFMLDIGGGLTLISQEVVAAAGCTPWGRVTGFQMMGHRLDTPRCDSVAIDIAGHRFMAPVALVLPPSAVEPKDADLQGSLALDAFQDRAITMDFGAGRLIVESPASLAQRTRTMTPLPIRFSREAGGRSLTALTPVHTAKGTLWMELDSGNGGTMLINNTYAPFFGLDSTIAGMQKAAFDLAPGVHVESDRFMTKDMIIDGNIGMPFLRHWILTLDMATSRGWIAPSPAAAPSMARD